MAVNEKKSELFESGQSEFNQNGDQFAGTDILSPQGIQKYLNPACAGVEITVMPVVTSTLSLVREKAAEGMPEGVYFLNINIDNQTITRKIVLIK